MFTSLLPQLRSFRLRPRPVPRPLWKHTLRGALGDTAEAGQWLNRISRPIRRLARACEICGHDGHDSPEVWKLCCDEVWDYSAGDELVQQVYDFGEPYGEYKPPLARLVDFQAICWRCNFIVHVSLLLSDYKHLKADVYAHGARVNGLTVAAFEELVQQVMQICSAQSVFQWSITWDGWETILQNKLDALHLQGEMVSF